MSTLSANCETAVPPGSSEDHDLLERSTRKKKRTAGDDEGDVTGSQPVKSFKETLMGNATVNEEWMMEDEAAEEVSDDEEEIQRDPSVPVIRFPKELKTRIHSVWRHALIVKLVGRFLGHETLLDRLQTEWHTTEFNMLYLGNGYFICKFDSPVESRRVLTGGPYFIGPNFLHVQKWKPNFRADIEGINSMVVWVRFPNVSAEYLDEEAVKLIASVIGKPIKLDEVAAFASRGRFARVCVQIDLAKPLLTKVQIKRDFIHIEYEGLPVICYSCGRVGHRKEHCIHTIAATASVVREEVGNSGSGEIREDVVMEKQGGGESHSSGICS